MVAYKTLAESNRSLSAHAPFALPVPVQYSVQNDEYHIDLIAAAGCEAFHRPCAELRTLLEKARGDSFISKDNSIAIGIIGVAPNEPKLTVLSGILWQSDAVADAVPELREGVLLSRDEYMRVHDSGGCVLAAMLSQLVRGWEDAAHLERFKSIRVHTDVMKVAQTEVDSYDSALSSQDSKEPVALSCIEKDMLRAVQKRLDSITSSAMPDMSDEALYSYRTEHADLAGRIKGLTTIPEDVGVTLSKQVKYSTPETESLVASTLQLGAWWSRDPKSALMRRLYQDRIVFDALGYVIDSGPGSKASVEFTRRAIVCATDSGTIGTALKSIQPPVAPGGGPPLCCFCVSIADAVVLDSTSEQTAANSNTASMGQTLGDKFRAEVGFERADQYLAFGKELQEMHASRIIAQEQRRKQ